MTGERIPLDELLADFLAWREARDTSGQPPARGVFADIDAEAFADEVRAIADRRRRNRDRPAFPTRLHLALHWQCSERTVTRYLSDNALTLDDLRRDWLALERETRRAS